MTTGSQRLSIVTSLMSDDKSSPSFTFNNDIANAHVNLAQGQNVTMNVTQTIPAATPDHLQAIHSILMQLPEALQQQLQPQVQEIEAAAQHNDPNRLHSGLATLVSVIGLSSDLLGLGDHYDAMREVLGQAMAALGG